MLGCIGIAPPDGQVLFTATAGPHGGSMDYLYLPVFAPGDQVYLGD
jgi:acetamidase/formamidase